MKDLEEAIMAASRDGKLNTDVQRILDLSMAVRHKLAGLLRIMTECLVNPNWVSDKACLKTLVNMFYERLNEIQYFAGHAFQDFLLMRSEQITVEREELKNAYILALEKKIYRHHRAAQLNGHLKFELSAIESLSSIRDLSAETGIGYSTLMRCIQGFEADGHLEKRPDAERHAPDQKRVGQHRKHNAKFFKIVVPLFREKYPNAKWDWCYLPSESDGGIKP